MRYESFDYNRFVRLSGTPDPFDPWEGGKWKPGKLSDWKTWINGGVQIAGVATGIYEAANNLPSRPGLPTSIWTPLPAVVTQGGATYYRNSSGLLSTSPQGGSSTASGSGGGGGSGGLPATVSQGGVTYYRNASGLLSASPGK